MTRRRPIDFSTRTASTRGTRQSSDSYGSRSTAHTSLYDSPRPSTKDSQTRPPRYQSVCDGEDLSPSTSVYPRSSVETYSSQASLPELEKMEFDDSTESSEIPPLPYYQHEIEDLNVRPSTPEEFADLFPSMNRLSIRHDDFTLDGNMNLRIETAVSGRRKKTIQLFHLRMHHLNRREFSLRRYCRDSGREVCNSKRKFDEQTGTSRPNLQRSVTSAVRTLTGMPRLNRTHARASTSPSKSRPGTSCSTAEVDDQVADSSGSTDSFNNKPKAPLLPTNSIKLEFANYARLDVVRRGHGNPRYEFDWWEHKYAWRRVADKLTGTVAYHLMRDGHNSVPVAHIVPETRTPTQVALDNSDGGWVPPCHMWISDKNLINARTDISDVVVATGLIALVDDCINERWQGRGKARRFSLPGNFAIKTTENGSVKPTAFIQQLLRRRNSEHHPTSPLPYRGSVNAC